MRGVDSLHIVGKGDPFFYECDIESTLYEDGHKVKLLHKAGHKVPSKYTD